MGQSGGGTVMIAARGSCEFVGCVFVLGEGEHGFGGECAEIQAFDDGGCQFFICRTDGVFDMDE